MRSQPIQARLLERDDILIEAMMMYVSGSDQIQHRRSGGLGKEFNSQYLSDPRVYGPDENGSRVGRNRSVSLESMSADYMDQCEHFISDV